MLTIYRARTIRSGADKVLSDIANQEGRHIVIVPDPFTLAVEQTVADRLGAKGVFDVEVMSFARLAAVALGGKIKKCLSPAGCVMLMEKVIRSREKELSHFGRAAKKAGFAAEMYAAITALRNSGVEPDRLEEAAGKLTGYIAKKTHEIALLYSAYLDELTVNHADSTTRLEALVRAIDQPETFGASLGIAFGDVSFHVIDHVDLNRKQLDVVLALARQARSVTVAVAEAEGADNDRIYPPLYRKLRREAAPYLAAEVDVPFDLTGDHARIAQELFAYSYTPGEGSCVSLASAKDMTEEVTYLATEITRLVREEGLRYRDVAVITPSFTEYLPYVERIFPYYGIPFFPDARYPLSECAFFLHVARALRIVEKDYDMTLLRAFVTHPLFTRVESADKAAFCDYVDKSGALRRDPRLPFTLFKEDPLLARANAVLAALAEELEPLLTLPAEAQVAVYTEQIKTFLIANDYMTRLTDYAEVLSRDPSLAKQSEILRRTPAALVDLLDTMKELRGEEVVTLREFLLALTAGAGQVKLAALPVSLDSVYFAAVEQAMYAPIPRLFVIGAEETLFPLEKVKEGILGQSEYAAWQSKDIEIKVENTGVEELAASKFHALQLLLRAERITLSHIDSKNPSPCIGQFGVLFGVKETPCAERLRSVGTEILIPTQAARRNMLIEYTRKEKEGLLDERERARLAALREVEGADLPPVPVDEESISPALADRLFFRKGTVNVSEIENFFRCPFLHFVRYGLDAQERQVAERDARDTGNLAHTCMESFVRDHVMRRPKGDISDEEAAEIATRIAQQAIADDARYQAIEAREGRRVTAQEIARCARVAVTVKNQIYASEFEPRYFERAFGVTENGKAPRWDFPRTILPEGVRLKGRMDRVDVLAGRRSEEGREYVSAIDYKTGSNDASAEDWYSGVKIQLPLYLEVLAASGYEPIAALYASLKSGRKSDHYLIGPKDAEQGVMSALDGAILDGKSPYTGMSVKEGEVTGKLLLSDEVFRAIRRYVVLLTEQAIREIRSGCIVPSALKVRDDTSPCRECEIKNVCRHAEEHIRIKVKGVGEEVFPSLASKGEDK